MIVVKDGADVVCVCVRVRVGVCFCLFVYFTLKHAADRTLLPIHMFLRCFLSFPCLLCQLI